MALASTQVETPSFANGGITTSAVKLPCVGCGHRTGVRVWGRPGHFACLTWRPGMPEPQFFPLTAAYKAGFRSAATESAPDEREPAPEEVSMFRLLQESIEASRKHPVMRIAAGRRELEPWGLMTETMRGEHRYRVDAPAGRTVKLLDRNGSYPSAMGNVPVAARELQHTGPTTYRTDQAGIYQIPRFEWPHGPHPLGEIAEQDDDRWWIATPHMRLCVRLTAAGRIQHTPVLDSYTAPAVTNLFKQFSADVSEARESNRQDPERFAEIKRKSSIAIRALWPKGSRSPFWRPDWSISVRAEASVRHWVRADQAITGGAELVKLGNVDEVAFLAPPRARSNWLPEPYAEGPGFGYVKVKGTQTATQWNRARRGDR